RTWPRPVAASSTSWMSTSRPTPISATRAGCRGTSPGRRSGTSSGVDPVKILVTGGAGFIGSNFVRHLLAAHPEDTVVNLDKLTYAGNPENLRDVEGNPRYRFVKGDICDGALVRELMAGVDAVVHMAAETHVDRSN